MKQVCWFPRTALTGHHNLGGQKQQILCHRSRSQKSETKLWAGPCESETCRRLLLAPFLLPLGYEQFWLLGL